MVWNRVILVSRSARCSLSFARIGTAEYAAWRRASLSSPLNLDISLHSLLFCNSWGNSSLDARGGECKQKSGPMAISDASHLPLVMHQQAGTIPGGLVLGVYQV